jgi:hypothetical protein
MKSKLTLFIGDSKNANWAKRTPDTMADLRGVGHVPAGVEVLKEDWAEELHPRDEHGHFIPSGGSRSGEKTPAQRRAEAAQRQKDFRAVGDRLAAEQRAHEEEVKVRNAALYQKAEDTRAALADRRAGQKAFVDECEARMKTAEKEADAHSEKMDEISHLLYEYKGGGLDPEYLKMQDELEKEKADRRAALDRYNVAMHEQMTGGLQYQKDCQAIVAAGNPSDILDALVLDSNVLTGDDAEQANKNLTIAMNNISPMVDQSLLDAIDPMGDQAIVKMQESAQLYNGGRAFFENNVLNLSAEAYTKEYRDEASRMCQIDYATAHEYGHYLESNVPGLHDAARAFLMLRTQGEQTITLRSATGSMGYDKSEYCRKDAFLDPYMGKIYLDGSTELISMGLQWMYTQSALFANKDPQMFDFIYTAMNGVTLP